MVTQYPTYTEQIPILGKIIAEDVPYEAFLEADYGDIHVEWVYGKVVEMPGIDDAHDEIVRFIEDIILAFLQEYTGGRIFQDPRLMDLGDNLPRRAPDLQVLLPESFHKIGRIQNIGPADLVVEVVSKGSERIDRVHKFTEYEKGGVREYWVIDPIYREALFYQLDTDGLYQRIIPTEDGRYYSAVLKGFWIPVQSLWQSPSPTLKEIMEWVQQMKS
jgi:Uma2 family endonuclease